jgi:hypothetical protein
LTLERISERENSSPEVTHIGTQRESRLGRRELSFQVAWDGTTHRLLESGEQGRRRHSEETELENFKINDRHESINQRDSENTHQDKRQNKLRIEEKISKSEFTIGEQTQ